MHLPEHQVKSLLRDAGIAVPRGAATTFADDVTAIARELRPPLVVKAYGPDLVHKSDAGAVRLGLESPAEAARAAGEMAARLGSRAEGFLVEEQTAPGLEVIAGLVHDAGFGPVIVVGLGGVWTEALNDTALRLCPISEADAREMLGSLRGAPLLYGYRGRPAVDVDALVTLLVRLGGTGGLWESLDLGEFELNPIIAGENGVIAVDARHLPTARSRTTNPLLTGHAREPLHDHGGGGRDFTKLFEPRAVAVVGASTSRPNFGNMFLEFYKTTGLPLVAVHPSAAEIDGVPCVPTLAEAAVDYALVAVPAARCADVVRQAAGVPYVQVMSGGFGEMGHPELEADLVDALPPGTRLLGPNCMGVYSPRGGQTFVGGGQGPSGHIALISQSGGLAGEVIKVGERRGLAFSRVATVGNASDVTPAELLRWLATDRETRAVGLYLEDPRDGRALFQALLDVRGRLPVVMLVGGRSAQGRRAAASHTGGMVSDARVWQALATQTGASLVTSQDDLIGALAFFQAHASRLESAGNGEDVLVIGPSGGVSVLAADVFDRAGLSLGALPGAARDALTAIGIGAGSSLANPLEIPVGPRGRPDLVTQAVSAIVSRQPYPDVVAHVNVQSFFTYGSAAEPLYEYARHLAKAQEAISPIRITLVTRNGECAPPGVEDEVRSIAAKAGIPVYRSMEAAATAVAAGKRCGGTHGHA
ncbi:acetate--CoA ligase family protein [Planotetraspora sp. A-T 1434]|uniref:acetate--CoA ligase family protein n=1 Tax=Planotetraspora sp. A-T 1434 TaxID=2979219 RepID=UPI0021C0162E|nr:acetate--CoA ligase family protein [Planotetraspora sp. A-T 1434]MCT9933980.1 acetate--CoA ligase family protein [Planotetraspora sp. A-T 1434]